MQLSALRQFCEVLELDPEAQGNETTPRYHLQVRLPGECLLRLRADHLRSLSDTFGDAFTLQVEQDGLSIVDYRGGGEHDPSAAIARLALLDPEAPADLTLTVDKLRVLEVAGAEGASCHTVLYLFGERLIAALDISLQDLDRAVFVDRFTPTLMVAFEGDLHYRGRCLTIASVRNLALLKRVIQAIPPLNPATRRRIARQHALAGQHLNRLGFSFHNVTPVHLLRVRRLLRDRGSPASARICAILRRHLCQLCILYTATRAVWADGAFHVDYAGPERTITLTFAGDAIPPDKDPALAQLALWPHSGATSDRLTVLQKVIARELPASDPAPTYAAFVERLEHLMREARWHYTVFVNGQIDAHFAQVQRLSDEVAQAAARVSAVLDANTKGLTETLLAALAAVAGSLLAGLAKGELGTLVFAIALRVYAVYVAVQAVIRLGAMLSGYLVIEADHRDATSAYIPILGRRRVQELTAPLRRHRTQLAIWFVLTMLFYAALAVGAWIAPTDPSRYLTLLHLESPIAAPTPMP
jgi:hypothetical protein